ncbi:MAG: hypothetical protein KAR40_18145, partial [Candidatus Sabulitectum sp.]|nr:hypothetical protein [Candidatus Sabulitectum sp.]
ACMFYDRADLGTALIEDIGNDEWYAYMNGDTEIDNYFPSFVVGRLSVKNGSTPQTDTLSRMIENLIALEQPIISTPLTDNRRSILRLAGTGDDIGDTSQQTYCSWTPDRLWTSEFSNWLGYDYNTYYCGDGRNFSSSDGSILSSKDYRNICIHELKNGAGVGFYTNHGEFHMLSAGLEWWPEYAYPEVTTKGTRDSTFNNYQIENQLTSTNQNYSAPFLLLLCCSAGTFNHTLADHEGRRSHQYFCHWDLGPVFDFGSDCLAEKLLKNTAVPVAGVFASSMPSCIYSYPIYGKGILKAVYWQGLGRIGDAVACARSLNNDYFMQSSGDLTASLGQFNLLGDPALDISDRVRYPNKCDLVLYPDDISIGYPVETTSGFNLPIEFTVRNNGRQNSSSFTTRIVFSDGQSIDTKTVTCSAILTGEEDTISYTWQCTNGFTPPRAITVSIETDYLSSCSDSWRDNNSAEVSFQMNDVYPIDSGWPIPTEGIVQTTPIMVNLDSDQNLEIVALAGPILTAYDCGQTVTPLWQINGEGFRGSEQPLAADLDQDGETELLLFCINDEIKVISNEGIVLYTLTGASNIFVVEDLHSRAGLELCTTTNDSRYLKLYYWENNRMNHIATKDLGYANRRSPVSLVAAGICGNTYDDVIYLNGGLPLVFPVHEEKTSVEVYNWGTSTLEYSNTWNDYVNHLSIRLSAGMLSGIGSVGYPRGFFETSGDPAWIIEPDETSPEISCVSTSVLSASKLYYGVFADWVAGTGADAFVLPSERQCMAWDVIGDPLSDFPTDEFSGALQGSQISPTALGNLNGTGNADVLFCTRLDGNWTLLAYDSDGDPLSTTLDFPYTLPEEVSASGGFAIGDLDRDGKVEIVFGTNDGLLHCWELGICTTGYAPWPQFQHDSGRSGVLE